MTPCEPHHVTDCGPCGVTLVRKSMPAHTPRTDPADDPNPTRARAIARARTERTKEQP